MGGIVWRLAFSGIRARRTAGALTIVVVAAAVAALVVGQALDSVAERPYERTHEAAVGAHVTAVSVPGGPDLAPLDGLAGVAATTGDVAQVFTGLDLGGDRYGLRLLEVGRQEPPVSRPLIVAGAWPGGGEVLLERSFADVLGLEPGDVLRIAAAVPARVSGVAVVPTGEPYPLAQPGLAFARESTLRSIEPDRSRWTNLRGLRLDDPERADDVAAQAQRLLGPGALVTSWTADRGAAAERVRGLTVVLAIFGGLLLIAAGAVLATLISGRALQQERELGLLKAVGVTPFQSAAALALEQLALAATGTVVGVVAGWLLTPAFVTRSAALLSASEVPRLSPGAIGLTAALVLVLVAVFSLLPAWRITRRPTAEILVGAGPDARRSAGLGGAAARTGLPVAAVLGLKGAVARRGRALLVAISLSLVVASAVATLGMEASLDVASDPGRAPLVEGTQMPLFDPVDDDTGEADQIRPVVYSLNVVLMVIALVNLLATLLLTVRERTRDLGILRAVGMTPRQVAGSLVGEHAIIALAAGLAGVPAGLALFRGAVALSGGGDEYAYPASWAVALTVPALVLLVAVLTAPLARRAAAMPVARAVRLA